MAQDDHALADHPSRDILKLVGGGASAEGEMGHDWTAEDGTSNTPPARSRAARTPLTSTPRSGDSGSRSGDPRTSASSLPSSPMYLCPECGKGLDTVVRWHWHRATRSGSQQRCSRRRRALINSGRTTGNLVQTLERRPLLRDE